MCSNNTNYYFQFFNCIIRFNYSIILILTLNFWELKVQDQYNRN